jgi:CheY-like chemotaxis protein
VSWSSPYQVLHVSDGFAALKMVRTLISQLILLDYLLPDMDGLECLDRL